MRSARPATFSDEIGPAITGVGLVTALGCSARETWTALLAGRAISDHARLSLPGVADPRRIDALAAIAGRDAIAEAGWDRRTLNDHRTALIVGTSKGPVEDWLGTPYPTSDKPSLRLGLAGTADTLAKTLGLGRGPRLTLSAACASGLHALIRGAMLLHDGSADRALVVAAEASVHELFLASFRRLGVLPPPGDACRPYDRDRAGFLMSDAAAAVCLDRIGQGPRLTAYALGADATHLTGTDVNGTVLKRLLTTVLTRGPVDLIHGHGTGTESNDPVELAAIEARIQASNGPTTGMTPPHLYSHKGAVGHSLGASGLVAVVLNTLCHRHGTIPPLANLREPLPATAVRLPREAASRPIQSSIALAAGFGGAMGAVRLEQESS